MKKTNKNLAGIVGLLVVAFLAVLVGVYGYAKASSNSAKYNAEGNMIVNEAPSQDGNLGSASATNADIITSFNATSLISTGDLSREFSSKVAVLGMPAVGVATTTAYFTNSSGYGMYVDGHGMFVKFSGTVSSTVAVGCGLSTSGTGLAAYTTTPPVDIIAATNVVTSTAGTAAASLVQPAATVVGYTYLPNGSSLLCGWYQPYDNGCSGSKCEAVTSTNRGYTAEVVIPYHELRQF